MAVTNPLDPNQQNTIGLLNTGMTPSTTPTTGTSAAGDPVSQIGTPPTTNTYGYNPAQRTVQANETVSGQFNELTKSDNPLIQMGRTMAKQQMNSKGLLNSSMAIGAADAAAYQTALPIAQADAKTYSDNAAQNVGYQNQALQSNTGALNDASKLNMSAWIDTAKANLDATTKANLANIEAGYKTLLQGSTSASDAYKTAMQNITDISKDPDMEAATKNSAIQTQLTMLKTHLDLLGKMNSLNLGDLLNFNSQAGTLTDPTPAA